MAIQKFFGCCSLRNGVLAWGVTALILDTAALSAIIAILARWDGSSLDFWRFHLEAAKIETALEFAWIPFVADQVTSMLLVFGAIREQKCFVLPWLVVSGILILGFVVGAVVVAVYVGFACVLLISLAIAVYIWLCVGAYYKSLRDDLGGVYASVLFNKE